MSETTQPVAEQPAAVATPTAPNAGGAPDELDTLLKQFEKPAETPKAEPTHTPNLQATDLREVVDFVRTEKNRREADSVNADIEKARGTIKTILADAGHTLPDTMLEGMMDAYARRDPRIRQAFMQRNENPQAWNDLVPVLAKKALKELEGLPDPRATEDREAVRAAVRSASTRAPEPEKMDPKKLSSMSDAEFNRYTKGLRSA